MSEYTIIRRADGQFDIAIVGRDGARQTMLGFATEADAEAWIEQDKRLNANRTTEWDGGELNQ